MKNRSFLSVGSARSALVLALAAIIMATPARGDDPSSSSKPDSAERRLLYVATPGVRDYLEYGGHGLLVFDIDDGHKFVKRIPTKGLNPAGKPLNVKGICASAATKRVHIVTTQTMMSLDLTTDKFLWEKPYPEGCDRMAISPDGKTIYLPTFEKDHWHVVNALDGEIIGKISPKSGSHNTVYGLDGKHAYLAGLRSPLLTVTDATRHVAEKTVGPFSHSIRPFTVNGKQTLCFVNINELLGFEIGDIVSGKKLHRVEVQGFQRGPVKRHGCPSHGIGLTPDEKEIWVVDAYNERVHIFDATVTPPKQGQSLKLKDEPGWITFTIDGQYAYPSTGDVIDTASKRIVAQLRDERGGFVQSEKMVEVVVRGSEPVRAGDQFGIGRVGNKN